MEFSVSKRSAWRKGRQAKAQFCMVCLNTSEDCKLFVGNTYNLDMEFERLTGISLQGQMHFEPQFCTECAQRLSNCGKFRDKSLRAYHLLLGLVELNKPLTIQNIKILSISNNLTSSIVKKSFQPNYCDLNLNHEELQEQEKLRQELAKNKPLKVQGLPNNEPIITQQELPINEPIKTQEDLLNNEPIKIEVKLFDGQLMLNPVPELENKIEPKSFDDSYSDFDVNIDCIDDDIYSDVDTQCVKRIKEKVDKFMNDVMNDTDNDWDFLKDSDSDNNDPCEPINERMNVSTIKTESKINFKKEVIRKPRTARRKRQQVKKPMKEDTLDCLKYFKVTNLTHEEQLEDIQKRKEKANYKNGLHKCNKCFKAFLNDNAYKTHMDRHTDKYGKSACPICALCFRSDYAVRHHVVRCHSTRYSCLRCPLVTNHDQAAINHANWHRGVTFTCPHCLEVRRSKSGYLSHLRIMHPTDTVCAQCGYSFVNERGLRTHIYLKHHNVDLLNPDGPLCEPCNIRFASDEAYLQHLDVSPKHAADGTRKRNTPQQKHPKSNNWQKNKKSYHKPSVTVTCEECGEQIKGFGRYRQHFRRLHPNKTCTQYPQYNQPSYLCDQCGKSFKSIYALRDHKLTHTGKKQLQCDMCKRLFYHKSALVTHMKTHSEEQPVFACAVCDKKFINKANCNRHSWTHKEQKPYQCHACDKSFPNASTLRAHVEHAHLKKPYPKKARGPRQRASRARHAKEPVCGTIWPKNYVNSDRQSDQTYNTPPFASGELQRPQVDLKPI